MGQYYVIANLDKREYLKPHDFDEGAKLLEFIYGQDSIMTGLGLLLAQCNSNGSGDAQPHPLLGSWAKNRITIVGDYWEQEDKSTLEGHSSLYSLVKAEFTNISGSVKQWLKDVGNE